MAPYLFAGAVATVALIWAGMKIADEIHSRSESRAVQREIVVCNSKVKDQEQEKKGKTEPKEKANDKRHTSDQEALSDLAKEAKKKGVTKDAADILLEWSKEYDFPSRDDRGTTHWQDPPVDHIHLGGKHIPIIN